MPFTSLQTSVQHIRRGVQRAKDGAKEALRTRRIPLLRLSPELTASGVRPLSLSLSALVCACVQDAYAMAEQTQLRAEGGALGRVVVTGVLDGGLV